MRISVPGTEGVNSTIMSLTTDWQNGGNTTVMWTFAPLPDYLARIPWLQITVMLVVLTFGVMSNLSVIFIVLKNRRLRSSPNIILVNLTVGDLLCLVINLPFIIDFQLKGGKNWLFGEFMCKLAHSSMVVSGCVTVYSLMALAIERYLAIAWPWRNRDNNRCVRFSRSCSVSPIRQIVLLIWIASFMVGTPIFITAEVHVYDNGDNVCMFIDHGQLIANAYKVFRLLAAYLIPLVTIVVSHALTACALLKSIREPVTGATEQVCHTNRHTPRVRSRVKLAVVISVLSVMFFIAWLPFYVYSIWYQFHFDMAIFGKRAMFEFYRWKDIPVYILSCLNPIVLYVLSSRFRGHLLRDCCCCFGGHSFSCKPAETFGSLKGSFLTSTTFRSRSTFNRRSSALPQDRERASTNEL